MVLSWVPKWAIAQFLTGVGVWSMTVSPTARTGEVQAGRLTGTVWGVPWYLEVDDGLVAAWATDGSLAPTEKERVLDDLVRSRHDLDVAWQPLAQRFSALVDASAA